ncbi:MAG: hypothetical protein R3E08_14725 [Thiotrichaceae bacterium]
MAKLRAFGMQVVEVDGHDIEAIAAASQQRQEQGALVILAYTNPYQGMDYLARRAPNYITCVFNLLKKLTP